MMRTCMSYSRPSEKQRFRSELVITYSPEDIRKFAASHPMIAIKPTGVGYSGRYIPSRDRIELDRKDGLNQGAPSPTRVATCSGIPILTETT